jgi:hypothetical protein
MDSCRQGRQYHSSPSATRLHDTKFSTTTVHYPKQLFFLPLLQNKNFKWLHVTDAASVWGWSQKPYRITFIKTNSKRRLSAKRILEFMSRKISTDQEFSLPDTTTEINRRFGERYSFHLQEMSRPRGKGATGLDRTRLLLIDQEGEWALQKRQKAGRKASFGMKMRLESLCW